MYLIDKAQSIPNILISVVSETMPHLKRGAIRDFINIMNESGHYEDSRWNRTDYIYSFSNNSKIEFFSADQPGKVRGPRRNILFVNEANNVPYETYDQLEIRTESEVWCDWNPTNEFWFYEKLLNKDNVDFLTLTYKDNEALSPNIVQSIESKKDNKNWWQVYGLGQLGEVEGRIYTGWQIIDEIPHEARLERYGLDFGFACLSGDTIIETSCGEKKIKDIKENDYVLTRNGYKKVINSVKKGIKEVYEVDFGLDKRIIITGDHRVYTQNGWTEASKLSNHETICVLRKSLKEVCTKDIQKENIPIISIAKEKITEKQKLKYCIEKFTKNITVKYLKDFASIILIKIHSIIIMLILLLSQIMNIVKFIFVTILEKLILKKQNVYGQEHVTQKKIGKKEEKNLLKLLLKKSLVVLNVVKKLHQQILIKNFADIYAGKKQTQEIVKKNMHVKDVVKNLYHQHITQETHVLKNVPVNLQLLKDKVEVYDITVEDEHEFFANGILVHNCDPTAITAMYSYNGGLIFDEIIHKKGLSNKQIADILLNVPQALTMADSAEPKSIEEIASYGVSILPSKKGQGSVNQGISYIQSQRVSVTKRSTNTIKAYRNYMWKTDKDGHIIDTPDHFLSDCMDSIRYAVNEYVFNVRERDEDNSYQPTILDPYSYN